MTERKERYMVTAEVPMAVTTVIWAESIGAALEIAAERHMRGLCGRCLSLNDEDKEWAISGALCPPRFRRVTKL